MAGRIRGITIEIGGDTSKLNDALKKTDGQLKKTQTALRDVNRLLKMDPGNTTLLAQKQKDLTQAIDGTKDRLRQLRTAEEQMRGTEMTEKQAQQYEALQREIIATEQDLKRLEDQMRDFGSVGAQRIAALGDKVEAFGGKLKKAGEGISNAGQALLPVTAAITAVGAASVAAWRDVDAGGDTIARMTGATGAELEDLQQRMQALATSIPTDFDTAGRAIGEVATRFDLTGDALQALSEKYIKFADVNGSDVTGAIDATQKAMAAWAITTEDAGGYLDALTAAAQQTGVKIETIAAQAATNAAALREVGMSASDAAIFLGQLEKNGVDASGAMAGLKKAYANALKDGTDLKTQLSELEEGLKNEATRAEASATAIELFGARSGAALADAIASGRMSFEQLGTTLSDFAGRTEETFDATLDPLDQMQTTMNELKLAGADLVNAMGPVIKDVLGKAADAAKKLTSWFGKLSDAEKQSVVKAAAFAAAMGPALTAIGKTVSTVGSLVEVGGKAMKLAPKIAGKLGGLKGGFSGVTAALGGLNLSTIAVTGAVGAAAAGFAWLFKRHQDYIRDTYGLTEAQKAFSERLEESAEAFRQQEAARQEAIAGVDSEISHYKALWAELQGMVDADGRIKSGYEDRAKVISGILSDGLGVEIEMTDNVIENYDKLAESMEKTIQKKRVLGYLEANQSSYQEALKGVGQAQSKYYEAIANSAEAAKKLKTAQDQLKAAEQKNDPRNPLANFGNIMHYTAAVTEAQKAFNETAQEEAKARDEYLKLQTTISNTEALMAAAESGQNLDVAMQNLAVGFKSAGTASKEMLEQQVTDFQTKYDNMVAAAESGMVQVSEADLSAMAALLERAKAELAKAGEAGTEAMAQGMQSQTPTVTTAAQGVSDAAAEGAQANTEAGQTAGEAFDNSVAAGVTAGAQAVSGAAGGMMTTAANGMTVPTGAAQGAGQRFDGAVAAGVTLGTRQVQSAVGKLGQSGVTQLGTALPGAQSGGSKFGQTYGAGIGSQAGLVGSSAAGLTSAALAGLGNGQYNAGYTRGSQYGVGLANGIRASIPLVASASAALAAAAPKTTGKTLRTGSPSRVAMELGAYYGEGLAIGMMDELGGVVKASRALAGAASSGTPAAMQYGPGSAPAAALAAQSAPAVTVTAPTDAAVLRAVQAVLGKMDTLSVGIRNAGQVMDTVTSGVNRRLGRISTLEGSGVI